MADLIINKLKIKSLKSLPSNDLEIRPLTLLAGINNSGKSTIIQAVRMFFAASRGDSPLLKGHGDISEIRSKSSSKNSDINISFEYANGDSDVLTISEEKTTAPRKSPHVIYIGADRLGPRPSLETYQGARDIPFIGERGEHVVDFITKLSALIIPNDLHHECSEGVTLEYEIKGWLNEISPGVESNFETHAKSDTSHSEFDGYRSTNVGFGLSYTLPVIAAILSSSILHKDNTKLDNDFSERWVNEQKNSGFLLALENPEAHLHPQGQTAMGILIAKAANSGLQIILETHSDHLMDGIRIAVKNGVCESEKIIFHYLEKDSDSITNIVTPKMNSNGQLESWPIGFFDQTLKNRAILAKRSR